MLWSKPEWNAVPGCFERHLQRREGNLLFPVGRRKISKAEIVEAQERDKSDQDRFIAAVKSLGAELENSENSKPGSTVQDSTHLQKVQDSLEHAAAVGGNIQNAVKMLEAIETDMIQSLDQRMPDGADWLRREKSLSTVKRNTFIAQVTRKDTPILSGEEVPALLSESLETISFIGQVSRSFPDFRPNTEDVEVNLDAAVKEGFDRKQAAELLAAWNQTEH